MAEVLAVAQSLGDLQQDPDVGPGLTLGLDGLGQVLGSALGVAVDALLLTPEGESSAASASSVVRLWKASMTTQEGLLQGGRTEFRLGSEWPGLVQEISRALMRPSPAARNISMVW